MALFHQAGLAMASYAHDYCQPRAEHGMYITSVGGHHGQIVLGDGVFDLLYALKVTQHISHRDNIAVLNELLGHLLR